jgi:hypothetical protein
MNRAKWQVDEASADKKLAELMLYIAQKSESSSNFGATKLNKILFFSELFAFGQTGKPITGSPYMKLEWGPAPRRMKPVQEKLIENGEAALQTRQHFGKTQKRLVALRDADLTGFTGDQISIVDSMIESFNNHSAKTVSLFSHEWIGWKIAAENEDIPLETVFLSDRVLTQEERDYAVELSPTDVEAPNDY